MDTDQKAKDLAQEIRKALTSGEIQPVFPTLRPEDNVLPTTGEVWDKVQEHIAEVIKPHIDDAYAAGKADGLKEAKGQR